MVAPRVDALRLLPSTRAGTMAGNAATAPTVAAFCKKNLLVIFMPYILPNPQRQLPEKIYLI